MKMHVAKCFERQKCGCACVNTDAFIYIYILGSTHFVNPKTKLNLCLVTFPLGKKARHVQDCLVRINGNEFRIRQPKLLARAEIVCAYNVTNNKR